MATLVALLSTGKGTWAELAKLIRAHDWDRIFLITNEFGMSTFNRQQNMEFILINPEDSLQKMIEDMKKGLKDKVLDVDVALNMSSGSGKEHMALLSCLLKLGLGIRLVTTENDKLKEI